MTRTPLLDMTPEMLETATGDAQALLAGAKAKLGFLPNMYGYMAKLPPVLAGYLSTYDAFRAQAGFTPAEQETVFLTISRVNGCTYCTAAHPMIADKRSGVSADNLAALRAGDNLPDAKLQAVAAFTEAMLLSRGNPGKPAVDAFLSAGYAEQHVLGVVLAIACKTFSNYVNHLAGTPVDAVFAPYKLD
ncbi:carboxymuconolactone decarboxylase family protein [Tabrizicola sp. TH137]|uniref:carboxymuconolactone decarboxylase family protein n=1 Tax=Tabrizicola sp. TH137 TaxID=2067452 RepID=UPI0020B257F4|nr:carboxymuconolactone decarboxylase family protein [Tabrizicola sp. TH137]